MSPRLCSVYSRQSALHIHTKQCNMYNRCRNNGWMHTYVIMPMLPATETAFYLWLCWCGFREIFIEYSLIHSFISKSIQKQIMCFETKIKTSFFNVCLDEWRFVVMEMAYSSLKTNETSARSNAVMSFYLCSVEVLDNFIFQIETTVDYYLYFSSQRSTMTVNWLGHNLMIIFENNN